MTTSRVGEETIAVFSHKTCAACPVQLRCPVRWADEGYLIRVTAKKVRLAKRRANEKTPAFLGVYRWRAGIEATISHLKNRTGAGHMRYRGLRVVQACFKLKAAGINILRGAAALAARLAEALRSGCTMGNPFVRHLYRALRAALEALVASLPKLPAGPMQARLWINTPF